MAVYLGNNQVDILGGIEITNLYHFPNGTQWTQSNITSNIFNCVYYANGIWVAGSGNNEGLYYSTDGKTWFQTDTSSGNFKCVYNANGIWVTGADNDGLYYSVTWELV